jgi:hypothetical protein
MIGKSDPWFTGGDGPRRRHLGRLAVVIVIIVVVVMLLLGASAQHSAMLLGQYLAS